MALVGLKTGQLVLVGLRFSGNTATRIQVSTHNNNTNGYTLWMEGLHVLLTCMLDCSTAGTCCWGHNCT